MLTASLLLALTVCPIPVRARAWRMAAWRLAVCALYMFQYSNFLRTNRIRHDKLAAWEPPPGDYAL